MTLQPLRRYFIIGVFALFSTAFYLGPNVRAQTPNAVLTCGGKDTIDLGSMLAGGTLRDTIAAFNNFDSAADSSIHFLFPLSSGFSSSPDTGTFLLHLRDTGFPLIFLFSDTSIGLKSDSIVFESTNDTSCKTIVHVSAEVVGPDTNNSIISLNHTSHDIIAFKSNKPGDTLELQFSNNFGSSVFLDSVTLRFDTAFTIVSSSLPATIPAGGSFNLKLAFIATKPGFYSNLITVPDHSILPFSVQGLLQPNDGVKDYSTSSSYISIYPNPSHGTLSIHCDGIKNANVRLMDVLGRMLASAPFTNDWTWSNTSYTPGTYFVIITGTDPKGNPIRDVERVVLE